MYCHHCVRSFAEDAKFCSQCGRRLHVIAIASDVSDDYAADPPAREIAAAIDIERGLGYKADITQHLQQHEASAEINPAQAKASGWPVLIGLAGLAAVVAAGVFMYYKHETSVNENVLRLQVEARTAALSGHYDEAIALLAEAAKARPKFQPILTDNETVLHAEELERLSNEIRQRLDSGDAEAAESELEHLKSELSGRKEPIYDKLKEKADGYSMELTLMELSEELATLKTVEEHGEMLNVVNGLIGQEAEGLRSRIIEGIRSITMSDVDYLLKRRNYSGAMSVCDKALNWAKEDAELLALRERIKEEKEAYERREQQRIEQAMENAAEEDLINQTDAIEVLAIDKVIDEFGDMTITGKLKNKATRPIYDVKISYSVHNAIGEALGSGTANATPDYIEPGEEMTFTATVYGVYVDDATVVIEDKTWYLD